MTENKWSICRHRLPYPLVKAAVSVSADESFAVITGGLSLKKHYKHKGRISFEATERAGKTIIFTEDKGFQLIDNYFQVDVANLGDTIVGPSQLGRAGHVSITVE